MPKRWRTITRYECEISKTAAELRSPTRVVLSGFDEEEMTRQQLEAALEMLHEVVRQMEYATDEEEEGEEAE